MSRAARTADTPLVDGQGGMWSRGTTFAAHAMSLADLCDDAAGGHPAQRVSLIRATSGVRHWYYQPTGIARYLVVRACVARVDRTTYTFPDGCTFDLAITDGTKTIPSSDARIPAGLKADITYVPNDETGPRFGTASYQSWALDLAALTTGSPALSTSAPWRFTVTLASDATAVCESFQAEEVSRFAVDTADAFGQLPGDYLPRGMIVDGSHGLGRMMTTLRPAMYSGIRTYHLRAMAESAPLTTTSTTWAALSGDTEGGSTPIKWRVYGRQMRAAATNGAKIAWQVRYKIVGASWPQKAQIRLSTGGGSSPYVIDLTNISGSWADSPLGDGFLATNLTDGVDTIYFEARTDAGTLSISARAVRGNPA